MHGVHTIFVRTCTGVGADVRERSVFCVKELEDGDRVAVSADAPQDDDRNIVRLRMARGVVLRGAYQMLDKFSSGCLRMTDDHFVDARFGEHLLGRVHRLRDAIRINDERRPHRDRDPCLLERKVVEHAERDAADLQADRFFSRLEQERVVMPGV